MALIRSRTDQYRPVKPQIKPSQGGGHDREETHLAKISKKKKRARRFSSFDDLPFDSIRLPMPAQLD